MSQLMTKVEEIHKRVRMGYPTGVDEQSIRDIPILLNRIRELEDGLIPFARAGSSPSGLEFTHVRHVDCERALQLLTSNPPPPPPADIPAHY